MSNRDGVARKKPNAYRTSTARGAGVAMAALAEAMNCGKIAGAGIEGDEGEPPVPADHPLLTAKNVIATPHFGFATKEALVKRAVIVFDNIVKWMAGTPQNVMK